MPRMTVLTAQARMTWMDEVRGTAILLLLLWHASAVPDFFGMPMPEFIRSANAFFLPFRMPTLMLLSGMLLARSMRKPLPRYLAGKLAMVVWPYLVWALIAKLTFLEQPGLPWWHWRAWYATSYLWFLFFIAVYFAAAPLLRRLPAWAPVVLATATGALLPADSMEQRMAYFAIFFFAGHWLAMHPETIQRFARPRTVALLTIPAVGFGAASVLFPEQLQFLIWGAPLSIAGSLVLIGIYSAGSRPSAPRRCLEFLGRSSLIFYVSHFPAMALISFSPLGDSSAILLASVNLFVSLLVGTLLSRWKTTQPICWLFQPPERATSAAESLVALLLPTRSHASREDAAPPRGTAEMGDHPRVSE